MVVQNKIFREDKSWFIGKGLGFGFCGFRINEKE